MRFRESHQNVGTAHDKSKQMTREKARTHYTAEKKEMEHELQTNQEDIMKALNDCYEYSQTTRQKGTYQIEMFNRNNKDKKVFTFLFEENYAKLRNIWEETTH